MCVVVGRRVIAPAQCHFGMRCTPAARASFMRAGRPDAFRANSTSSERRLTRVVSPRPVYGDALASFRNTGGTAVLSTIYAWRREYARADVSAGRSATACAVTLRTSGAATARIAERSLGARSSCMGIGPSRLLR